MKLFFHIGVVHENVRNKCVKEFMVMGIEMKFYANVKGRVNNFTLSSKDALLPLYETMVILWII